VQEVAAPSAQKKKGSKGRKKKAKIDDPAGLIYHKEVR